jgi:hypothetical protein
MTTTAERDEVFQDVGRPPVAVELAEVDVVVDVEHVVPVPADSAQVAVAHQGLLALLVPVVAVVQVVVTKLRKAIWRAVDLVRSVGNELLAAKAVFQFLLTRGSVGGITSHIAIFGLIRVVRYELNFATSTDNDWSFFTPSIYLTGWGAIRLNLAFRAIRLSALKARFEIGLFRYMGRITGVGTVFPSFVLRGKGFIAADADETVFHKHLLARYPGKLGLRSRKTVLSAGHDSALAPGTL